MKGRIIRLLEQHGVLNGRQTCRLLNGFDKNDFSRCYFTFQEKPKGTTGLGCRNSQHHKCRPYYRQVLYRLSTMPSVQSRKMRFYDKGGIGSDLFRFFFLDVKEFEAKILRYTLIPYLEV